jgi:hypothetical protein
VQRNRINNSDVGDIVEGLMGSEQEEQAFLRGLPEMRYDFVLVIRLREHNCSLGEWPQRTLQIRKDSGGDGRATEVPANNLFRN